MMKTDRSLNVAIARTMDEFNAAICEILESNPRDIPFAALYRVESASPCEHADLLDCHELIKSSISKREEPDKYC